MYHSYVINIIQYYTSYFGDAAMYRSNPVVISHYHLFKHSMLIGNCILHCTTEYGKSLLWFEATTESSNEQMTIWVPVFPAANHNDKGHLFFQHQRILQEQHPKCGNE